MNTLPDDIIAIFYEGEKAILDGYFRFISADKRGSYADILKNYKKWEAGTPFAISVFGDILVWTDDGYIKLYNMVNDQTNILIQGSEYFEVYVTDKEVQADYFDIPLFLSIRNRIGSISEDECYTFEPIPALGGRMAEDNVHTGDSKAYLAVIVQLLK